jgi:hypothetical protein
MGAALAVLVLFAVVAFYPAGRSPEAQAAPPLQELESPPQSQPDAVPASATPAEPPMRVEIVLTRTAFVSASADGRSVVSREMAAGERALLEANRRAVVRVSDPSAVNVSIDGQPEGPLGTAARSATFEITRDGVRNLLGS